MTYDFDMDHVFTCANCGIEGTRYTLEEAIRTCGVGYGEWYCMDGEGCSKEDPQEAVELEG